MMSHFVSPEALQGPANALRPPARLRPLRKLALGVLGGALLATVLLASLERRHKREPGGAVPAPREWAGPAFGVAEMKGVMGGEWLGTQDAVARLILKPERIDATPQLGSGYSPARGGPGAAWGPVARPQSSQKPSWAFAGLSAPPERGQTATTQPLHVGQPDLRPDLTHDPMQMNMRTPGHLRWNKRR